jgi:AraC-like DNA-binding protein
LQEIDLLLRGAALGATALVGLGLIAGAAPPRKAFALITFFILIACYILVSSPDMASLIGGAKPVFVMGAIFAPVGLTWAVLEILFDRVRERRIWIAASFLAAIPATLIGYFPILEVIHGVLVLLLYLGLLILAILTGPDDLVEKRRAFRRWFVACMALFGIAISVTEIGFDHSNLPEFIFVFQAVVFLVLSLVFGLWVFTLSPEIWPVSTIPEKAVAPKDSHLVRKLTEAMDAGAWRQEGLTVGGLAEHIGVTEHRLRAVINQGLNFRNFSTYINGHRIEAAKQALDDPEHSGRTILEIAYDTGFSSLGPFNKAFRAYTGQSPREYRARSR